MYFSLLGPSVVAGDDDAVVTAGGMTMTGFPLTDGGMIIVFVGFASCEIRLRFFASAGGMTTKAGEAAVTETAIGLPVVDFATQTHGRRRFRRDRRLLERRPFLLVLTVYSFTDMTFFDCVRSIDLMFLFSGNGALTCAMIKTITMIMDKIVVNFILLGVFFFFCYVSSNTDLASATTLHFIKFNESRIKFKPNQTDNIQT